MTHERLAPMRPKIYVDSRPASYFDRSHAHARVHEPDWVYTLIPVVSYPYCRLLYRLHAQGIERVHGRGR